MSLKELNIKKNYDSDAEDVLHNFYIPALSESEEYLRLSGFFSSSSLAIAAKGINNFVKNGGKMKLITGLVLNEEDLKAIKEGLKKREQVISEKFSQEVDFIEDDYIRDHVSALAWMVANKRLEIKLALIKETTTYNEQILGLNSNGLFHQKVGILYDNDGNRISFSGSDNESASGWTFNIEEFKVFREWVSEENAFFKTDIEKFDKFWNNKAKRVEVIDTPEAVEKKLIKIAPKEFPDIKLSEHYSDSKKYEKDKYKGIKLRHYQNKSIENWENEGFKGIINIATGCGKTLIGLEAINKFLKKESKRGITIITAPTKIIGDQWEKDLKEDLIINENKLEVEKVISCNSKSRWERDIQDDLHNLKMGRINNITFIVTNKSLKKLTEHLEKGGFSGPYFLIGDEVHSLGSRKSGEILNKFRKREMFKYTLGLSATPERFFDEEGTEKIKSLFGKIIYNYELGDAIKEKYLSEYNYYLNFIPLSRKELYDYNKLTKEIGKHYAIKKEEGGEETDPFVIRRSRIMKKAENKFESLKRILEDIEEKKDLKYTLIFCEDNNQLKRVEEILNELGIYEFSKITEDTKEKNRQKIIYDFKEGITKIILTITIFNEGVDISKAKNAILLSSTTNPREFIQRRGRVLRKEKDKKKVANIYDFFVHPPIKHIKDNSPEKSIINKELNRISYFIKESKNKLDLLDNEYLREMERIVEFGGLF